MAFKITFVVEDVNTGEDMTARKLFQGLKAHGGAIVSFNPSNIMGFGGCPTVTVKFKEVEAAHACLVWFGFNVTIDEVREEVEK